MPNPVLVRRLPKASGQPLSHYPVKLLGREQAEIPIHISKQHNDLKDDITVLVRVVWINYLKWIGLFKTLREDRDGLRKSAT